MTRPNNETRLVPTLYQICLKASVEAVVEYGKCKFKNRKFADLPTNVLFDFYNQLFIERKLCLLGVELSDIPTLLRLLDLRQRRRNFLKNFQILVEYYDTSIKMIIDNLRTEWRTNATESRNGTIIDMGLRIGTFFKEGGWYEPAIELFDVVEEFCKKCDKDHRMSLRYLDCLHKRLYIESYYCITRAGDTYKTIKKVIKDLQLLTNSEKIPSSSLAATFCHIAAMYLIESDYQEAYNWSKEALKRLDRTVPKGVTVDVLRITAKSCVVKRHLKQAELLITQAMSLATEMYECDQHPRYADVLMDYGFFLLNNDCIPASVVHYKKALSIRREVFEKNNILVAIAYEDLSYAQYVNEYSSGNFYNPKDNAERAIRILEKLLPNDHLLVASAKRVKALILEEIALDMREINRVQQEEFLVEAEELHKGALRISKRCFGEHNVQTAKHYGNLGRLYQTMMRYEEAEKMHHKAIKIKEQLLGPDDFEVGLSVGHLASLYNYHMEKHKEAEALYLRSIDISLKLFGHTYSGLEYDYRGIMHVYRETVDIDKLLKYDGIMQEWKKHQETPKSSSYPESCNSVDSIVKDFFKLELSS